jgi:linoleoyl-CoA desaturase
VTSAPGAAPGYGHRAARGRPLEPWRDAAAIGVVTHLVLLLAVLAHPGVLATVLLAVPLAAAMSVGTLTVLHDAGHRMFGRTAWPNVVAVQLAVPAGLWVGHWTLKHRVHHKLSQVYPVDESTRSSSLLRLHAEAPLRPVHRYQHLYAWLLYSLAWLGELRSQLTYLRTGVVPGADTPGARSRTASFLAEKLLWLAVLAPYGWLLGPARMALLVLAAETVGSLLSAVVLVVGHVNIGLVDDPGTPRDWAAHLVRTTASFRTGSAVARYLTGGMTHHLAHHLRPAAPRSQLPVLHRTAVRELVERRGLQQSEYATFAAALRDHYARLHELGAPSALGRAPGVLGAGAAVRVAKRGIRPEGKGWALRNPG